jgi:hypothetical protein
MSAIELVDLDSVEIVTAVERVFGIKINDSEAERCESVGDLFDVVLSKVPHVERGALPCHASMAFRRIRRAIRENSHAERIAPDTKLSTVMPASGQRKWWRRLAASTGLTMPSSRPSNGSGRRKASGLAAGCIVGAVAFVCGAAGLSLVLGAMAVMLFTPSWGVDRHAEAVGLGVDATVGDLAKIAAGLNAGELTKPYSQIRKSDAWAALEGVIRDFSGFTGPIERRTRFNCV